MRMKNTYQERNNHNSEHLNDNFLLSPWSASCRLPHWPCLCLESQVGGRFYSLPFIKARPTMTSLSSEMLIHFPLLRLYIHLPLSISKDSWFFCIQIASSNLVALCNKHYCILSACQEYRSSIARSFWFRRFYEVAKLCLPGLS